MHYINGFAKSILFLIMTLSMPLMAAVNPTPLSSDTRIRTVIYQENDVFNLRGLHGYQTTVQLGNDETIESIDLGDTSAWTLSAGVRSVTLKPVADNADTNMTIRTTKRLYLFQLSTPLLRRDAQGIPLFSKPKDAVFLLKFTYPESITTLGETRTSVLAGLSNPPTKVINRFYTARGDETILPRAVYDDGQFTYFDFSGIQPLPTLYTVDKRRREYMVNKRMEGHWLVYEGAARQYTLRYGDQVASIFNDMTVKK
jgi:type IV secretion system protein VirB9